LIEQRRATGLVETAGGTARVGDKQQSARCSRKTQNKFAIASMAKMLLHRCICAPHRLYVYAYDFKSKVNCGSALGPGASGLPYYCTLDIIEGPAVWRHNKPKTNSHALKSERMGQHAVGDEKSCNVAIRPRMEKSHSNRP